MKADTLFPVFVLAALLLVATVAIGVINIATGGLPTVEKNLAGQATGTGFDAVFINQILDGKSDIPEGPLLGGAGWGDVAYADGLFIISGICAYGTREGGQWVFSEDGEKIGERDVCADTDWTGGGCPEGSNCALGPNVQPIGNKRFVRDTSGYHRINRPPVLYEAGNGVALVSKPFTGNGREGVDWPEEYYLEDIAATQDSLIGIKREQPGEITTHPCNDCPPHTLLLYDLPTWTIKSELQTHDDPVTSIGNYYILHRATGMPGDTTHSYIAYEQNGNELQEIQTFYQTKETPWLTEGEIDGGFYAIDTLDRNTFAMQFLTPWNDATQSQGCRIVYFHAQSDSIVKEGEDVQNERCIPIAIAGDYLARAVNRQGWELFRNGEKLDVEQAGNDDDFFTSIAISPTGKVALVSPSVGVYLFQIAGFDGTAPEETATVEFVKEVLSNSDLGFDKIGGETFQRNTWTGKYFAVTGSLSVRGWGENGPQGEGGLYVLTEDGDYIGKRDVFHDLGVDVGLIGEGWYSIGMQTEVINENEIIHPGALNLGGTPLRPIRYTIQDGKIEQEEAYIAECGSSQECRENKLAYVAYANGLLLGTFEKEWSEDDTTMYRENRLLSVPGFNLVNTYSKPAQAGNFLHVERIGQPITGIGEYIIAMETVDSGVRTAVYRARDDDIEYIQTLYDDISVSTYDKDLLHNRIGILRPPKYESQNAVKNATIEIYETGENGLEFVREVETQNPVWHTWGSPFAIMGEYTAYWNHPDTNTFTVMKGDKIIGIIQLPELEDGPRDRVVSIDISDNGYILVSSNADYLYLYRIKGIDSKPKEELRLLGEVYSYWDVPFNTVGGDAFSRITWLPDGEFIVTGALSVEGWGEPEGVEPSRNGLYVFSESGELLDKRDVFHDFGRRDPTGGEGWFGISDHIQIVSSNEFITEGTIQHGPGKKIRPMRYSMQNGNIVHEETVNYLCPLNAESCHWEEFGNIAYANGLLMGIFHQRSTVDKDPYRENLLFSVPRFSLIRNYTRPSNNALLHFERYRPVTGIGEYMILQDLNGESADDRPLNVYRVVGNDIEFVQTLYERGGFISIYDKDIEHGQIAFHHPSLRDPETREILPAHIDIYKATGNGLEMVRSIEWQNIVYKQFAIMGDYIAYGVGNLTLLKGDDIIGTIEIPRADDSYDSILSIEISPSGKILVSTDDDYIYLFEIARFNGADQDVPEGYAPPIDPQTGDLYLTADAAYDGSQTTLEVTAGLPGRYTYKTGYYLKDNLWRPFQFDTPAIDGSNWIRGEASATISNVPRNGWAIAYVCRKQSDGYICGPRTATQEPGDYYWTITDYTASSDVPHDPPPGGGDDDTPNGPACADEPQNVCNIEQPEHSSQTQGYCPPILHPSLNWQCYQCDEGYVPEAGECVSEDGSPDEPEPSCNECEQWARSCDQNNVMLCYDSDNDGCTQWEIENACSAAGQVCVQIGETSAVCAADESGCPAGQDNSMWMAGDNSCGYVGACWESPRFKNGEQSACCDTQSQCVWGGGCIPPQGTVSNGDVTFICAYTQEGPAWHACSDGNIGKTLSVEDQTYCCTTQNTYQMMPHQDCT